MGCSTSRVDSIIAKAGIGDPSPSSASSSSMPPKTRSFSSPLVHHPALTKGDTHHLVSLTSTTYGSLPLSHHNHFTSVHDDDNLSSDSVIINAWELMQGLEDDDNFHSDALPHSASHFYQHQKLPDSKPGMNLVDYDNDFKVNCSNRSDFNHVPQLVDCSRDFNFMSSNLRDLEDASRLSDSYVFVEMSKEIVQLSPTTKPLWEHLSEESLLSMMDPFIGNAYERAMSAPNLGYDRSRTGSKSMGSPLLFSKSDDNASRLSRCEDKIVLYFTSLRGIRKTYEDCSTVRTILRGFRVVVDERDISMDSSFRKELQSALLGKGKPMRLPQLFIRGEHIGGVDDVKLLHETGELEMILEGCPTKDCGSECQSCGDARFVPCSNCYGSRKVFQEEEGQVRKCPDCNENGLVRCRGCCP